MHRRDLMSRSVPATAIDSDILRSIYSKASKAGAQIIARPEFSFGDVVG